MTGASGRVQKEYFLEAVNISIETCANCTRLHKLRSLEVTYLSLS